MDKKEEEVWEVVLTYTDLIMHGKVDEFLEHFHDDYTGWSNIEPLPADKQSIVSELRNNQFQIINQYDIIPIKIKIHDKVAIVHYYLVEKTKTDQNPNIKHYTDVLLNTNNKWILIADHFGIKTNKEFKNTIEG